MTADQGVSKVDFSLLDSNERRTFLLSNPAVETLDPKYSFPVYTFGGEPKAFGTTHPLVGMRRDGETWSGMVAGSVPEYDSARKRIMTFSGGEDRPQIYAFKQWGRIVVNIPMGEDQYSVLVNYTENGRGPQIINIGQVEGIQAEASKVVFGNNITFGYERSHGFIVVASAGGGIVVLCRDQYGITQAEAETLVDPKTMSCLEPARQLALERGIQMPKPSEIVTVLDRQGLVLKNSH
ncbi:MAG: hypothetical protein NUV65_02715 [Candidatus Roizmanbacteria bacterium]|nr:hypothetical protein [Candidatus Roizmanbacteria bacterium]